MSWFQSLTPQQREVNAEMARQDLYFFSRYMFRANRGTKWLRASHHKTICDALMRVFRGECKRLIINIPPRYSKTELAIVMFIAWSMGHVSDAEFIHVSYASELAGNNSSHVLDVMKSEAYADVFKTKLRSDAKHHWRTEDGGVMYTTGDSGTLTGFGAGKMGRSDFGGAILIDDPHKPEEARSEIPRKGVINRFQSTIESRKNDPSTPIVLIMQRLHEEDLAGWLLAGNNGEEWEHIMLEALTTDADGNEAALWSEKHTLERLKIMQRAAPYVFAAQYQQRPSPAEGGLFKPDQLATVEAIPANVVKWCRGWDFGSTVNGDYSSGAKIGKLSDGRFIIADVKAEQRGVDQRDAMFVNVAKADGVKVWVSIPQDPGQAGKTQVLYMTRMLPGYRIHSSPESGDKETRAEPFAAQVNVGNVLIVRGDWNDKIKEQMRNFPFGKYKDMVDSCSRAFAFLVGGFTLNIADGLDDIDQVTAEDMMYEAEMDI